MCSKLRFIFVFGLIEWESAIWIFLDLVWSSCYTYCFWWKSLKLDEKKAVQGPYHLWGGCELYKWGSATWIWQYKGFLTLNIRSSEKYCSVFRSIYVIICIHELVMIHIMRRFNYFTIICIELKCKTLWFTTKLGRQVK